MHTPPKIEKWKRIILNGHEYDFTYDEATNTIRMRTGLTSRQKKEVMHRVERYARSDKSRLNP
jgi:hypothetical protein